jgi:hypothetical protein
MLNHTGSSEALSWTEWTIGSWVATIAAGVLALETIGAAQENIIPVKPTGQGETAATTAVF